jgi:hypothetical protein
MARGADPERSRAHRRSCVETAKHPPAASPPLPLLANRPLTRASLVRAFVGSSRRAGDIAKRYPRLTDGVRRTQKDPLTLALRMSADDPGRGPLPLRRGHRCLMRRIGADRDGYVYSSSEPKRHEKHGKPGSTAARPSSA